MKKYAGLLIILFIPFLVQAETRDNYLNNLIYLDETITSKLNDNNYKTKIKVDSSSTIKITSETEIHHIYIIYNNESSQGTLTSSNDSIALGSQSFLHEYIKVTPTKEITINYNTAVTIKEIFTFDSNLPSWVQRWEPPHEEADIMLLSTHSDDEHLFFAGLIPTMINLDKSIQLVYLTNHYSTPERLDEQLNGLWAVGVKNYPIIGFVPDAYSESLKGATNNLERSGYTLDNVLDFQIDMINKFKPLVIVAHDEQGEYSHGQHILNTHTLKEALAIIEQDTDNYLPSKVYIHLYPENKITMNYDVPLEKYNGATAYEISKLGYAEHNSQQYTWFTKWLLGKNNNYTSATQITTYSPLEYGLYYSTVGYEVVDNDMFYNIKVKEEEILADDKTQELLEIQDEKIKEINNSNSLNKYIYLTLFLIIIVLFILIVIKKKK